MIIIAGLSLARSTHGFSFFPSFLLFFLLLSLSPSQFLKVTGGGLDAKKHNSIQVTVTEYLAKIHQNAECNTEFHWWWVVG